MSTEYKKPLPRPLDPGLTEPFWEAAKRHEFILPHCKTCDNVFWYPRSECPNCMSNDIDWVRGNGRGRVHTFTIIRQPGHPGFIDDVPYIYAIIQLDEGPRMISNVVDCPIEDVKIDMPVVAVFDDITPEWTLIKFKPA